MIRIVREDVKAIANGYCHFIHVACCFLLLCVSFPIGRVSTRAN
jgi:hypothetical protein